MQNRARLILEERASSETATSVILIAFAAILLSAALGVYYGSFNNFFSSLAAWLNSAQPG